MKALLILVGAAILLACKKPADNAAIKHPKGAVVVNVTDTAKPLFSPQEEAKIKEDSLLRVKTKFPFIQKHPFSAYPAQVFTGTIAAPDFKNDPYANDAEYVAFITNGCKQGINFGGHYTIIEKSCGAMCQQLFIVDRKTGNIFTGTLGLKEVDGYYGFKYEKDSFLLITDATVLVDATPDQFYGDDMVPAVYKWNGSQFIKLK